MLGNVFDFIYMWSNCIIPDFVDQTRTLDYWHKSTRICAGQYCCYIHVCASILLVVWYCAYLEKVYFYNMKIKKGLKQIHNKLTK